jgi:hypothetical protein
VADALSTTFRSPNLEPALAPLQVHITNPTTCKLDPINKMAYTFEQARELVRRKLDAMPGGREFRIVNASVSELQEGWIFGYQSAGFLETGDISKALVGNIPMFVTRDGGDIFLLSQHRPLIESMAAYRACGDPNATLVPEVELLGWREGANAVAAIQGIRRHSLVTLAEAKSIIDRCLCGERCVLRTLDIEQAKLMVATLESAGFASCVQHGVPSVRHI